MAGKRLNESSIPAKYTAPNEVIYAIVLCHIIEIEKSLHWNIVNSWKLDKQGPEGLPLKRVLKTKHTENTRHIDFGRNAWLSVDLKIVCHSNQSMQDTYLVWKENSQKDWKKYFFSKINMDVRISEIRV